MNLDETLYDKAMRYVYGLCDGSRKWTMSVPVKDDDTDMVIHGALIKERSRALAAERELAAKDARIAELEEAARWRKWPKERPEARREREYFTVMDDRVVDNNYWDGKKWEWDNVTHWRRIDLPEEG